MEGILSLPMRFLHGIVCVEGMAGCYNPAGGRSGCLSCLEFTGLITGDGTGMAGDLAAAAFLKGSSNAATRQQEDI